MELLRCGAQDLGIELNMESVDKFKRYYEQILAWNSRVNLTSITDYTEVQKMHFLDSLTPALAISPVTLETGRFADIGTGAGFPGIPLKIAYPNLSATLIEARSKKVAFLKNVKTLLGLKQLTVLNDRSEKLAHIDDLRGKFDFVVTRAVSSIAVMAELALPFCRLGGRVILQKKIDVENELDSAYQSIQAMGGMLKEVKEIHIRDLEEARVLVVLEKIGPTPKSHPRRPGIPQKRPL